MTAKNSCARSYPPNVLERFTLSLKKVFGFFLECDRIKWLVFTKPQQQPAHSNLMCLQSKLTI